ncbi:hypothetical protein [Robertmurraya andreesenii]|uniref:Uncharacterized protein n=1 Tax=Anoxybacillus andreesenii TaxID=1325932 RepID=A0ABT9V6F1_9BACL|nr:hypothetical protein [Robertmurraya andreesenii]MDQ0156530.1 hypothetical protein [Robertmurraya andreesenii]
MNLDQIDAGEITEIYNYIDRMLTNLQFELRSEGTYQTKQIFLQLGGLCNEFNRVIKNAEF